MSPEAAELNVSLGHVHMGQKEPQAEHGLGQNIEDGIGNNLAVNVDVAGAIGNTPDAAAQLANDPKKARRICKTYTGYAVHSSRVKPAIEAKKPPTLPPLAKAMARPWMAKCQTTTR